MAGLLFGLQDLPPGPELRTVQARVKNARHQWEHYTYRYANQVPLAEGADALRVNWCEVPVTNAQQEVIYHNGFITSNTILATAASTSLRCWRR